MTADGESGFQPDPRLIDAQLGGLNDEARAALARDVASNVQLAADDAALAEVFDALRSWRTPTAPASLHARIMARVHAAAVPPRVVASDYALNDAVASDDHPVIIPMNSLRNIVAVAAMVVLAVGVGVPSLLHMQHRADRILCSNNLAAIGQAIQGYANVFNQQLPFAGWSPASSWQPSADPTVEVQPNRRHVYPLLLTRMLPADSTNVFVCPSSDGVVMPAAEIRNRNDFLEGRNLTYAYQNMAGLRPSFEDAPASMPIIADDNPIFEDGVPVFEQAAFALGVKDPTLSNSRAHGGGGQNLLSLDGAVRFVTSPKVGIDGDNIWTIKDHNRPDTYTGREGPTLQTDTHLLK